MWAKLERPFFKELGQLVRTFDPDAIVCVQQIPSRLLQLLEQEDQTSKPQYVVVTDVIAHSTWINYGVAGYFLPNSLSRNLLIQRGLNPNVLHVTGIPVKLEIMQPKTKEGNPIAPQPASRSPSHLVVWRGTESSTGAINGDGFAGQPDANDTSGRGGSE